MRKGHPLFQKTRANSEAGAADFLSYSELKLFEILLFSYKEIKYYTSLIDL